jgi:nitrous oxide reductase accessory protein NosL
MSYVSTIAFATRKDAEEFQRMHGGRIIAFTQALIE